VARAVGFVVTGSRIVTRGGRVIEGPRRLFNPDDSIFTLVSVPTSEEHPKGVRIDQTDFADRRPEAIIPPVYYHLPGVAEPFTGSESGTGFVVSPDGLLITNRHVLQDTIEDLADPSQGQRLRRRFGMRYEPKIWVFLDGRKFEAELVHVSQDYDLALLKVHRQGGGPYLRLLAQPGVARGTPVYTLGFPGIVTREGVSSVAKDEIQDRSRQLHEDAAEAFTGSAFEYVQAEGTVSQTAAEPDGSVWINHTAEIRRGNSGGPLVRASDALVLGINTVYLNHADTQERALMSLATWPLRRELAAFPSIAWSAPAPSLAGSTTTRPGSGQARE
jgi:S1-C subfamily serine protease